VAGDTRIVRLVLTGDSASAVRALEVTGAAAEKTKGSFEKMQTVGRGMSSLGRSMTTLAVPLVALGVVAVKTASTFQSSMTLLRTQVGVSASEVTRMSKAVLTLAPRVGEGPNALAAALYPIESVGLRGARALDALKAAAMGAQVSGASLTDTADAISGALKTQLPDVKNAASAMAIMNGIVAQGKLKLTDLIGAMGTGILVSAKGAGLGFRDVGDAIAAMTRQGIPAQAEATRLRLTLTQFEAPKNAALKALQGIGLGQFSLADDLRKPNGLIVALQDLRSHLSGVSRDQQNATISAAFGGGKGSANVVALLNALPSMQQIATKLTGASAAQLASAMALRLKDASAQWDKLKATAQVALIGLGNSLMPLVTSLLPKLVSVVKGAVSVFSGLPKPVKEIMLGATLFLAIGGPILMFFGGLITAVTTILPLLGALSVVLDALPFVALFTAIGIAIILLVTHFKQVKTAALDVFRSIGAAVIAMGTVLGRVFTGLAKIIIWPFKTAWTFIRSVFNGIMGDVRWLIGKITGAFRTIIGLPGKALSMAGSVLHTASFGLLNAGGPVKARYYDTGGPVGADTVPGWLTPGEFVLKKAAVSRVGVPALTALNDGGGMGGMGGNITIEPGQVIVKISERVVGEASVRYFLKRGSRGSSSLVGGAMLTGSTTAG
jgi:TP901 family phage tail tape measure protein